MNDLENKVNKILKAQLAKSSHSNAVVAVQLFNKKIDLVAAAGYADYNNMVEMTPSSPYFIASITKMYTAAVAMQMWEQNLLDIEAPISKYLPASITEQLHIYKGVNYSSQIKVYQLINQTSGLPDFEAEKPKGDRSVLDKLIGGDDLYIDMDEALRITAKLSPHFAPGTPKKAFYSNLNYRLLGEIIKNVSQKSLAENFTERIYDILGLESTYSYDWTKSQGIAPATIILKNAPVYVPKYLSSNDADGGIVSTVAECILFLRGFFEGKLFDKSMLDKMTEWNKIFFPLRYGYGLMKFQLPRYFWFAPLPEFIGHSGSTGSFSFVCPSKSLYISGTLNQVSPAKPYMFKMNLIRAIS